MNVIELFLLIDTGLLLAVTWKLYTADIMFVEFIEEKE
jgi:hypothetical protein